jgi:hypothetical protein
VVKAAGRNPFARLAAVNARVFRSPLLTAFAYGLPTSAAGAILVVIGLFGLWAEVLPSL